MASFRIGQRVRLIYAARPAGVPYVGLEAIIVDIGELVSSDGIDAEIELLHHDGEYGCVDSWQIEPIQDDGRKVVAWSECLWQPNHESAPA